MVQLSSLAPETIQVVYDQLAEFRSHLRRYLQFSEELVRSEGVEPQQYLLLLMIKGLPRGHKPTITTIAERLHIRHHSAVELVTRAADSGLIERTRCEDDRREVHLKILPAGESILSKAAVGHYLRLRSGDGQALIDAISRVLDTELH
ncbi:MAG: MarR family transcriptional regulator [Cyanobacteria bacterium REEB65]|nr:MarR family transcriptional regulator [Cyanobacteria bacterium REEB65]